jgi:nitrogen regulatory protein P-II 2
MLPISGEPEIGGLAPDDGAYRSEMPEARTHELARPLIARTAACLRLDDRRCGRRSRTMKIVTAIIKPFKLDDVRNALTAIGVDGMTITEVRGNGHQNGHTEIFQGSEYALNLLPKIKIEVAIPSHLLQKTIDAISVAARTGHIGDGKIFVIDLDSATRIRTGEMDTAAV